MLLITSSQKQLVTRSCSLLLFGFILASTLLIELSNGNKTVSNQQQQSGSGAILAAGNVQTNPTPILTTPALGTDDEPSGDDGKLLKKDLNDIATSNKTTQLDQHTFYKPEYITKDPERAMSYWVDFSKLPLSQNISTKHEMLSKSHRRAAPIKLSFEFPFYGQPLKNIIIATGGFLYVGEHLHHWLAATQNISPLMANFDLSTSSSSDIHYYDNGTALVVQWLNVQMKDNKPPGNFSFQVTLFKNGDIVFVYKSLPVASISDIPEEDHPVKVGISDAFLIDKVAFFIRRKTIYDYHRLNLKETSDIGNQTAIYLKALPTCNQYDTCETCSKAVPEDCIWCPAVKRCSNGFDRKRQEWLTNQCEKIQKSDCSIKTELNNNNLQQVQPSSSQAIQVDYPSSSGRQMMQLDKVVPDPRVSEGGTAFVTLLMFMALTSGVALWVFYAYKNPHTPSGQLLIKYRPSNWRWQNAETRYTAASIHM